MSILAMLFQNLRHGAVTLRFPARPRVTERYRGLVRFDPALCSGCAICKLRCTSRAITYTAGKGEFYWAYDPSRCTFCGRCVEGCKTHALTQEAACPPVYTEIGALKVSCTIARTAPASKAAIPATATGPSQPAPSPSGGAS